MRHRDQFQLALFNLQKLEESFRQANGEYEHNLNSFLSSVQAVFWSLNKKFTKCTGYEQWSKGRSDRLPPEAKIFKELRNISLKEGPIKNSGVILGFDFGAAGITIPAHATVTFPWIDRVTGKPSSYKAVIETVDGHKTEVQPVVLHDFSVTVESDEKVYHLDHVILSAKAYLDAVKKEIITAEEQYLTK